MNQPTDRVGEGQAGPSEPREPYLTMAFKALYPNITRPVAWPGLAPHKWLQVGDLALAIEATLRASAATLATMTKERDKWHTAYVEFKR